MFFSPSLNKLKYPEQYWLNKKLDIIHIQNSFLFHHVLRLAQLPKSSRPKIVISMVGGETYVKSWFDKKWTNFYSNQGHQIDAYTVQSKHQKTYLSRWGINPDRIHVIPVSFGEQSNAEPKLPNKNILKIVSAFRMTWEKNIEGNLRFAKILNEKNIPFQYDIYGDGNDLGQLYYLVDAYNLIDKVFIHRKIENNILKQKLREYDFYLQLSISEALSASVIEAQSLGLPCIVSNSDGISEAIVPNLTGISGTYLDLNILVEQTLSLWNNHERYFQYSLAAIKFANENYTVEKETERISGLYNSLTQKNS